MWRRPDHSFPAQAWREEFARSLRGALGAGELLSDHDVEEAAAAMAAYLHALDRDAVSDTQVQRWVFRVLQGLHGPRCETGPTSDQIGEWTAAGYLSQESSACGGGYIWIVHLERFPVMWGRATELTLFAVLGTALAVLSPVFDVEGGDGVICVRGLRRVLGRILGRRGVDRRMKQSCRDVFRTIQWHIRRVGERRRWKETPIVWTEAA